MAGADATFTVEFNDDDAAEFMRRLDHVQRRLEGFSNLKVGQQNSLQNLNRDIAQLVGGNLRKVGDLGRSFEKVAKDAQASGATIATAMKQARDAGAVGQGTLAQQALTQYRAGLAALDKVREQAAAGKGKYKGLDLVDLQSTLDAAATMMRGGMQRVYEEQDRGLRQLYENSKGKNSTRFLGQNALTNEQFAGPLSNQLRRNEAASTLANDREAKRQMVEQRRKLEADARRTEREGQAEQTRANAAAAREARKRQQAEEDAAARAKAQQALNAKRAGLRTMVTLGFGREVGASHIVTGTGDSRQVWNRNTGGPEENEARRQRILDGDLRQLQNMAAADRAAARSAEQAAEHRRLEAAVTRELLDGTARFIDKTRGIVERGQPGSGDYVKRSTGGQVESLAPDTMDYARATQRAAQERKRAAEAEARLTAAMERQAEQLNQRGMLQNFLGGATSRGFGAGQRGFQGTFDGLAQSAGVSVKYAAIGTAIYSVTDAMRAAAQEYLDFVDSNTELQIALDDSGNAVAGWISSVAGTESVGAHFVGTLSDIARTAGSNVGEAMDVAASGIRAFGQDLDDAGKQAVGSQFADAANVMAVIAKTDLRDAAGNVKAIGNAFNVDPSNFTRINDAIAGAKRLGGGDEKQTAQFLASIGPAADAAGFQLNEIATLGSRIQALTDESGSAVATRLSRVFAIVGGNAGKNAITRLNQSLAPDQQIDTTANLRTQLEQLSEVYGTLGEAQRQQLVNSLGGTANTRELITLLENYQQAMAGAADSTNFAGKGTEEFNRRLNDVTGTLRLLMGDLKGIATAIGQSGLFAPLVVGLKALEPALNLIREILQAFNAIPAVVRLAAFGILQVVAAMKLLNAVRDAGGVKNLLISAETRIAPGRALAKRQLAERDDMAAVGGARAASVALPSRFDRALVDASHGLALFTDAAREAQRTMDEEVRAAAAKTSVAEREAAGPHDTPADADTAAKRLDRARAKESQVRAEAAVAMDQARQDLADAESRWNRAEAAQRRARRVMDPADERFITRVSEADKARQPARDAVERAQLHLDTIGEVAPVGERARFAVDPSGEVVENERYREALDVLAEATEERAEAERNFNNVVRQETNRRTAAERLAGNVRTPWERARGALRADAEYNARGGLGAFGRGARMTAAPFTAAFGWAGHGGDLRGRQMLNESRLGQWVNTLGRGRLAEGEREGGGRWLRGAMGNVRGISRGVGDLVKSELGTIGIALIGFQSVLSTFDAGNRINDALQTFRDALDAPVNTSNIDSLNQSAQNLHDAAAQLRDASSGFWGNIVDFLRGGEAGQAAKEADEAAKAQEETAKRLQAITDSARKRGDDASTIDVYTEEGIGNGLDSLAKSGRDATHQFDALITALQRAGTNADGTARALEGADLQKWGTSLGGALQKQLRGASQIADGQSVKDNRYDHWYDYLDPRGSKFKTTTHERDRDVLGELANSPRIQDVMGETQVQVEQEGLNVLSPEGKKRVIEILQRKLKGLVDNKDLSPEGMKALMDAAVLGVSQTGAAFNPAAASVSADEALARGLPLAQQKAQETAQAASLGGDARGGAYAGAQATVTELTRLRGVLAAKKDVTQEQLQAMDQAIGAANLAVQDAAGAYLDGMRAVAESLLPQTDTRGRIAVELSGIAQQLDPNSEYYVTDADAQRGLRARQNDLRQQDAQQAVRNANAARTGALDPRDDTGRALTDMQNAKATLDQITATGDTSSDAYWNAAADYKAKQQAYLDQTVADANSYAESAVMINDNVGEAEERASSALRIAQAALQGSPDAAAKWRAYRVLMHEALLARIAEDNAIARAALDPRDEMGNLEADRQEILDILNDPNATATDKANARVRQRANARDTREAGIRRSGAERLSGIDPRNEVGRARRELQTEDNLLHSMRESDEGYWEQVDRVHQLRVEVRNAEIDEMNAVIEAGVDPRDPVAVAQAAVRVARNNMRKGGTAADMKRYRAELRDARIQETEAQIDEANLLVDARTDPDDRRSVARAAVDKARNNRKRAFTTAQKKAADREIANALAGQRRTEIEIANDIITARVDPLDSVAVANAAIRTALNNRKLAKDPGQKAAADREIANARVQARRAEVARANARNSADTIIGSDVDAARRNLQNANRDLALLKANQDGYWEALAAQRQAMYELAEAQAAAAHNAYRLTIDLTDPVAAAEADLKAARDKLTRDIKRGADKPILDQGRLDVRDAENAREAAIFSQQMNDWDIADRLGRITHERHLAYLQGEHDRLTAIVNRTRQQQDELDQVDLAMKDMKDNINSALSGQFNLGDIRVPTVYEVRRSLAIANGTAGGAGTSVDNSNSNNTVIVNGADFARVVEYINQALGQSAQVIRTTSGRKV